MVDVDCVAAWVAGEEEINQIKTNDGGATSPSVRLELPRGMLRPEKKSANNKFR